MTPAIVLLLLQVSGPPDAPPRRPAPPADAAPRRCPSVAESADVVVCAPDSALYRIQPVPANLRRFEREAPPPRAEMALPGGSALSMDAERGADAQGGPINRVMVRLKIPLGRKGE